MATSRANVPLNLIPMMVTASRSKRAPPTGGVYPREWWSAVGERPCPVVRIRLSQLGRPRRPSARTGLSGREFHPGRIVGPCREAQALVEGLHALRAEQLDIDDAVSPTLGHEALDDGAPDAHVSIGRVDDHVDEQGMQDTVADDPPGPYETLPS